MKVTLQLREPVARELSQVPDRDEFADAVLARALEKRRRREPSVESRRAARRLDPEEARALRLPGAKNRQRELEWRRSHRDELVERFAGKWVVLEGEEIVAADPDAAKAAEMARAKGVSIPFIFYVEESRPGVVALGL